jgi:hypothetical protein
MPPAGVGLWISVVVCLTNNHERFSSAVVGRLTNNYE